MKKSNELILPEKATVIEVYSSENGLDQYVQQARDYVADMVPDISTAKGRAAVISIAAKVGKLKSSLDGMGKDLNAENRAKINAVDATRKRMRDELSELQEQARKPVTDWEESEKLRIEKLQSEVATIQHIADNAIGMDREALAMWAIHLESDIDFEELQIQADLLTQNAKVAISTRLQTIEQQEQAEKEAEMNRVELARLQQVEADRLAAEQEIENNRIAEAAKKQQEHDDEMAKIKADNERLQREKDQADADAEAEKQRAIDAERIAEQSAEIERLNMQRFIDNENAAKQKAIDDKRIADDQAKAAAKAQADAEKAAKASELRREAVKQESIAALATQLTPFCKSKAQAKALANAISDGDIGGASMNYLTDDAEVAA